ncbi:MAG: hypothetical protein M9950_11120 [Thermomicrobiales bacterium]|nr:hypothetical protein [Thermomicrobiales bacterium]
MVFALVSITFVFPAVIFFGVWLASLWEVASLTAVDRVTERYLRPIRTQDCSTP